MGRADGEWHPCRKGLWPKRSARRGRCSRRRGCPRLAYSACASFDSTEEGNIGPAADFLADRAGDAPVLMSAGFPAYNITVHQGYLFYRSRLVSESIKRLDPLTPMTDPDLVRFLSHQTRTPVSLLSHRTLLLGREATWREWEKILASGVRHVLTDTSDDGDVEAATHLAADSRAVVVASDPLIVGLSQALAADRVREDFPPLKRHGGPGAVLVGSVGPVASEQFSHFRAHHPGLTLNPLDPRGEAAIIAEALQWAATLVRSGPIGVSTDTAQDAVEKAQKAFGSLLRRAESRAIARRRRRRLARSRCTPDGRVGRRDFGRRRRRVGNPQGARAAGRSRSAAAFALFTSRRRCPFFSNPARLGRTTFLSPRWTRLVLRRNDGLRSAPSRKDGEPPFTPIHSPKPAHAGPSVSRARSARWFRHRP